jgi:O-antigen/teichoic acid export membrane protein
VKDCLQVELEVSGQNGIELPVAGISDSPSAVGSGFGRRRLTINTASNIGYYILLLLIGLWYTPFMLHRIPESVYGLVPLATSFTSHLVIITTMITGPVCRYVSADLARGDLELANATFNSFLFGGLKIMGALALVVLAFCIILPVRVPAGHEMVARFLFAAIGFSFLCSAISSCFEIGYWVNHRFEIRSMLETAVIVLRNGVVVVLLYFFEADVWQIAVAAVAASVFQLAGTYTACRRLAPQLRIDYRAQTAERKKMIYSVGRWLMLAHGGNQLLLSTDLILINRFFGTVENTKYGVLLLSATIVRSIFSSLGLVLVPAMTAAEAQETAEGLAVITARAMRIFGGMVAHVTGILCGVALPLLTIWIHKDWVAEIAPLAFFVLLGLCFELSAVPLTSLLIAPERIARYGVSSIVFGIVAVGTAALLLQNTDLHFYAVAISFSVAMIIRNGLVNAVLAADGLPVRWYRFAILGVPMTLRFVGSAVAAHLAAAWIQPTNVFSLAGCVALAVAVVIPLSFLGLPKADRDTLIAFVLPGK